MSVLVSITHKGDAVAAVALTMALVDRTHWTERLPAWPLLEALAQERPMETRIALVDSVTEVPEALARLSG